MTVENERSDVPSGADAGQSATPYADAVRAYARQPFVRLDVAGHCGDAVAQPELADLLGERVLSLDVPPLVNGIDQGPRPTPLQRSAHLAAEAWGARRTWLLTNGGSKGNLVAAWRCATSANTWSRSGACTRASWTAWCSADCHGHFVAPDVDAELGAAHGLRPESLADGLDAQPDAVAAYVVTPSGSSRQTGMGSVRSPTTRTRREADQTLAGALPRESCPLGAMHGTGPADSASGVPGRAGACEACESAVVLRQLGADPCPAPSDGRWSCSL